MAVYRRTALRAFSLANNAYIGASVTFYTVDLATGQRTGTLATLYDAPSGGSAVPNPYTLDSSGKVSLPLYYNEPIVAVVGTAVLETHTTGIIYPVTGQYRGSWVAAENYLSGDIVTDGSGGTNTANLYIATEDHLAGSVWATDLGLYWALIVDIGGATDAAAIATAAANTATTQASSATASASTATTQASSATASASTATTQAAAAVAAAASLNIASPQANKYGALLVQNNADDGYDLLSSQGTAGQVLTSGGADALPTWGTAFTDEQVQDAVGGILTDTATIDLTYSDGANTITADVKDASLERGKFTDTARQIDSSALIPGALTARDYIVGYYNETVTLSGGDMQSGAGTGTVELYLSSNTTSASGTIITGGSFSVSTTVDENTFTAANTVTAGTPRWVIAKCTAATGLENVAINVTERR